MPATYMGPISDKINALFRTKNLSFALQATNNFKLKLQSDNTKITIYDNAVIYKITCADCDIGQNGQHFHTRFNEYIRDTEFFSFPKGTSEDSYYY